MKSEEKKKKERAAGTMHSRKITAVSGGATLLSEERCATIFCDGEKKKISLSSHFLAALF